MTGLARRVFFLRYAVALAVLAWLAVDVGTAKVRVRAHRDETFDFRGLRTWAWHPTGAGDVRMALTADDNPAAVKERYGPTIMQAVEQELPRRGLTLAGDTGQPNLYVNYYVLISTNMSAQTLGQFAPSVPEWGLPLFSGATQSLRVIEQGSLVLDVTSSASKTLVWRAVAQTEIDRERKDAERMARIRDAIKEMIGKFPTT